MVLGLFLLGTNQKKIENDKYQDEREKTPKTVQGASAGALRPSR
jgi:hypothetical protein